MWFWVYRKKVNPELQPFTSASYVVNGEYRCWERVAGELSVVPSDEQIAVLLTPVRARYRDMQPKVVDLQVSLEGMAMVYLQC